MRSRPRPLTVPARDERRVAIDVARVLALLVVVFGHLLLAVIDRHDGAVRGANLLELRPGWSWIATLAPMPVFFAAGGWANATATPTKAAPRLRVLVGLACVVVASWSTAVVVASAISGDAGVVGDGARIATQPLWFLAAYLVFAANGQSLGRLATHHLVVTIACSAVVLAMLDVSRFAFDAPEWVGWPGFYLAWGVPWLIGGWWRSHRDRPHLWELELGAVLFVGGTAGAVALVARGGYTAALIDAVPGGRSNTNPPTLYTAVAGMAQVGLLMLGAHWLDRLGRWRSRLWTRLGEAAVGIYVWHLTALALCAGVVAVGLGVPDRLSIAWWVTRPLWWGLVLAVTFGLVILTAAFRSRTRPSPLLRGRAIAGIVIGATAGALVGLRGPRTVELATMCTALFVVSWLLLRGDRADAGGTHVVVDSGS